MLVYELYAYQERHLIFSRYVYGFYIYANSMCINNTVYNNCVAAD